MSAARHQVCAIALAECFRGDGEILASPIGVLPQLGARLARATFAPDLMMTDGVAALVDREGAVEGWMPYRLIFDLVWSGRRHVIMGASQIDRFGNQNIACIGDPARPKAQLLGMRGAPGNTINHATSYFVPQHTRRVFVATVDVVTGIGTDRAAALGPVARFHDLRRVVSNLAVMDFGGPERLMRLLSVHPGVTVDQVVEATGFPLAMAETVAITRGPTVEELELLRRLDPDDRAAREVGVSAALHTRLCDLLGIRYPIIQTGMGWVSGARLTAATSAAGGFGILGSATMTLPELAQAIGQVQEQTQRPFGVNMRPDQEDLEARIALLIESGVALASFAGPPGKSVVAALKAAGILTMPTVGARRHAEKMAELGVDLLIAQGGEGGGHTGEIPTSLLLPQVCDAVDLPVIGAGGFHDGRGLVAALAYGCSGIAMGTRFLMTRECAVPDPVKDIYLGTQVNGTVVTRHIDGAPQRVIRTEVIDRLERAGRMRRFFRALGNAMRFRRVTGGSRWGVLREGLAMRRRQELPWAQLLMAANAPMMTRASMVDGRPDVGILPTGQVVGLIDELPTVEELLERIMAEATETLARLHPGVATPAERSAHG